MKIEGRVAIITGAGSGIGRAMAQIFAAEGARLVLADVDEARLKAVEAELPASAETAWRLTDVSKKVDIEALVALAMERHGRIDILCNNAGIMDRSLLVDEVSEDLWDRVLGVNLKGPYLACHLVVPIMVKQGKGAIVNTASLAGLAGSRAGAAYTSSKHALVGLTKNVAATFGSSGIRCNAICPGHVRTKIMDYPADQPESQRFRDLRLQASGNGIRIPTADPEEIARVALFLVSDDASFLNGAAIPVDGGRLAA
jgi:NAD(P)-dependent dehydrogenase (short-subunit alcohol dehydrogenase family)